MPLGSRFRVLAASRKPQESVAKTGSEDISILPPAFPRVNLFAGFGGKT
jgi:hypothetical protein